MRMVNAGNAHSAALINSRCFLALKLEHCAKGIGWALRHSTHPRS